MESHAGASPGPDELAAAADAAAELLVQAGRSEDPAVADRFVGLVEEVGLETLAELWSHRPARSLPGALWRLYLVREWVQRQPEVASREYASGSAIAPVSHVIAGVEEPPGPREVQTLLDAVLAGLYQRDLDSALDRCAAFCAVTATGRAQDDRASAASAADLMTTAEDLAAAASLWRAGELD
ncbi:hypothetical protein FB557_0531 [Marihabitans asiaticum]|uniref:DNA-directed RNA polymerase subunit beta n=2 Tax=Marihabitans asiaticum TaxID=415218 RepID=A0A560WH27_9MICO|nr:hypothetical protein FB557_0531 [Marihabitans asiaticum]